MRATINPISNNAPTISSSATFSAAENQTAIGSVTATDADGDSLTYSISGSEINISSSGVLTFALLLIMKLRIHIQQR